MSYNHQKIEPKWQKYWEEQKMSEVQEDDTVPPQDRRYILDMFPYPSGAGLHVGHPEGWTATDIYARYLRMKGYQVLHPMGWDAFGLPAENYAIKQGVHPYESTLKNIDNFRRQIKMLGFSYNWSREITTCNPEYYRWTQWFFLLLYKNGLAYRKKAPVNWCGSCQTVLAREQAIEGKCERCKNQVVQKELRQWFFKITDYVERLLSGLDKIDWPEPIKLMQRNWIGKSEGALIKFQISKSKCQTKSHVMPTWHGKIPCHADMAWQNPKNFLEIFTTRPDTIFGATYMVVAPEHSLIIDYKLLITNYEEVKRYIDQSRHKTELERTDLAKEKTGVEIQGIKAINPASGELISIWIADYVVMGYGTGAIMAVPAHDERDFEFAGKYGLPIKYVIEPTSEDHINISTKICYLGEGILINAQPKNPETFNGMPSEVAKEKIVEWLAKQGLAKKSVQYKLRDWLISRQRYWGAPIPIIYCEKCGELPVPEDQLPIKLPNDVDFRPKGESPLKRSKAFHKVECPKCGSSKARRESDTMDTFVCSSWYYFRYTDPRNAHEFASKDKIKYWLPVSTYVGGAEHAVMHLLYARFFCKVLYDQGIIDFEEPFQKLINQGLILAEDGRKMSKSLGNVINPDNIVKEYGADTLRIYEMFMGPLEDAKPWSIKGIRGVRRFLEKVWKLIECQNSMSCRHGMANVKCQIKSKCPSSTTGKQMSNAKRIELERLLHQTIKKVSEDIEMFKFNTAISQLMILVNKMQKCDQLSIIHYQLLISLLAPFAPHLAEELWRQLGNQGSIFKQKWPEYNVDLIKDDLNTIVVQINGKVRDQFNISVDASPEEILKQARDRQRIQKWIGGQKVKKEIYVPNRIVNFVI